MAGLPSLSLSPSKAWCVSGFLALPSSLAPTYKATSPPQWQGPSPQALSDAIWPFPRTAVNTRRERGKVSLPSSSPLPSRPWGSPPPPPRYFPQRRFPVPRGGGAWQGLAINSPWEHDQQGPEGGPLLPVHLLPSAHAPSGNGVIVTQLTLTPTPVVARIQHCVAAYGVRNMGRGYQQTSTRLVVLIPITPFFQETSWKAP